MSRHPFARFIGTSYAHVQHGLDQLIEWSVTKLKQVEHTPTTVVDVQKARNKYVRFVGTTVRGTLGFVGTLAESYFSKYRELKKNEARKETENPT